MGGRFSSIDRTSVKIWRVARISQRERLFLKFDPILFSLTQIFIGLELDWGAVKIQWFQKNLKKGLCRNSNAFSGPNLKFKVFFRPKTGDLQKNNIKKKKTLPAVELFLLLHHYSHGIWFYIWPDFVRLLPLIYQRSNLDGGTLKSRWGDAQSRWGTLNLDGGTRPPYKLSTVYNIQRG